MTNGTEMSFENGEAAEAYYASTNGRFEVKNIAVKNGVLTLAVEDISAEIEKANKEFAESYKNENGVEPSFLIRCY